MNLRDAILLTLFSGLLALCIYDHWPDATDVPNDYFVLNPTGKDEAKVLADALFDNYGIVLTRGYHILCSQVTLPAQSHLIGKSDAIIGSDGCP